MDRPLRGSVGRGLLIALAGVLAGTAIRLPSMRSIRVLSGAYAEQAGYTSAIETPGTLQLADLQSKFEAIAARISPAVVAISASNDPVNSDAALRAADLNPRKLQMLLEHSTRTVGTGFFIDSDGYILTSQHVVNEARQLWVVTDNRQAYPAIIVGSDPRADLAVLKIPAHNMPVLSFASEPARRGQWAIALGNPYGLASEGQMAMSVGVVSALHRSLPELSHKAHRLYSDLIQTTAEINPGNSGGPLIDIHGNVIGLNAAVILPQSQQTNGIGFATPVTADFLRRVNDLKQGREVAYGYLGVTCSTPTPAQRQAVNLRDPIGAVIDAVDAGSPAAAAGLQSGDIVISLNGRTVRNGDNLIRLIGDSPVDKTIRTVLLRGRKIVSEPLTLSRRSLPAVAIDHRNQRLRWRGLLLGPIPAHWNFGKTPPPAAGVMVMAMESGSPLAGKGISTGAIITAIGGQKIAGMLDLQNILNQLPPGPCDIATAIPPAVVATLSGE